MFEPDTYLELIRDGHGRLTAAREAGGTIEDVSKHCEHDVQFREAIEVAELEAFEQIDKALFDAAVSGSVAAIKAWIEYHVGDYQGSERPRITEETQAIEGP